MRTALPRADINVTPMIDVMLVLLIIFMVVVPVIASVVDLPVAVNSDPRAADPEDITLFIERNGALLLETGTGERTSWDDLHPRLAALYMTRTRDRILYLKADSALEFGVVERATEIARQAGVRVVGAVTQQRVRPRP